MPMCTVHYPAGTLSDAQKTELGEELTAVLLRIEGGQDTPGGRSIAWVLFNEIPTANWFVGGRVDNQFVSAAGKFLIVVTVPEGSMDKARKSDVHREVNERFLKATGTENQEGAGRSVWVQIAEIPEGHWGTSGKTAGVMGIAMVAGLTPLSPILDFTRSYLDAKERWMDAADYPEDAAGRAVVRY